jgi:hypothetical protein
MARQCNVDVKDRREAMLSLLRVAKPAAHCRTCERQLASAEVN